jgi:mRNA interferase MazF
MKAGEIALAQLQQADGRPKTRPVLVFTRMPPFSDHLVCALSSKLQHECIGFDEVIASGDDDFPDSGLKVSSLIRLGMVATIPSSAMLGILGRISEERLNRLRSRLARHIMAEVMDVNRPLAPQSLFNYTSKAR